MSWENRTPPAEEGGLAGEQRSVIQASTPFRVSMERLDLCYATRTVRQV